LPSPAADGVRPDAGAVADRLASRASGTGSSRAGSSTSGRTN